jgi:hypothetical protein
MKILIIEASYPDDFYDETLDGQLTLGLTKILGIEAKLVFTVNHEHFEKALTHAVENDYTVIHISCHGGGDGIALTDNTQVSWENLAKLFQTSRLRPDALVMSACCGAARGLADAFKTVDYRPKIMFGSMDKRTYRDYALAWSILYNRFERHGVRRDIAQQALKEICAVVHKNFRYFRWDDNKKSYRHFPLAGVRYSVQEARAKPRLKAKARKRA